MAKKNDQLLIVYINTLRSKMKARIGEYQASHYPLNITEATKLWEAGVHPDHAWECFLKDMGTKEIIALQKSGHFKHKSPV